MHTYYDEEGPVMPCWPGCRALDPPTQSSCQARHHAETTLTRLGNLTTEKIGWGIFFKVYKVTHRNTAQVCILKVNTSRSNQPYARCSCSPRGVAARGGLVAKVLGC
ncbi:hypothetical protein HPB51_027038 [Rhipicephalus microplus]|uniref:Uncharacterized protein n=1 Tax=Rhipicephalus microplus TaxID=6941 RepID=A0A9J6D1K2_RHIMP|nr:hypothetical protein HPB51_027038 [Rhipicephalus microplus]